MERYRVTRIDELDRIPIGAHGLLWRPVRRRLGIEAFGVNAYTCEAAGEEVVEPHDELGGGAGHHEELYVVVSGHAVFTLDGEEHDAPAGTLVFCKDPAVKRAAIAREAGTTVLAIGGARGEAYRVSPWESYFAAKPLADAGDPAGAARIVEEALVQYPDHPSVLYNLACYRALANDLEAASEALLRSFDLDPRAREWAREDSDLDALRDRPEVAARLAAG
jgi:tetratricopeptide (TPR) repeat protein